MNLLREAEDRERPASRVRRHHGGQDAQRYLAGRLLRGDRERVAIGVILHHRATRRQLGGGPRIPIRNPHATHLLGKEGPVLGSPVELTGLQTCIKNMKDMKIKLVNMVQVMLVRRILPCQRRDFNLWEFVPTEHQTLQSSTA